jgi:hypothetical protein
MAPPRKHALIKDLLARQAYGYSGSGSSQHSRASAHGNGKPGERADGRPARVAQPKDAREFLARTNKQIAKLRCALSLETKSDRRQKLERDYEIKLALAERLEQEVHPVKPWNYTEVITLPGDGERPEVDWINPHVR